MRSSRLGLVLSVVCHAGLLCLLLGVWPQRQTGSGTPMVIEVVSAPAPLVTRAEAVLPVLPLLAMADLTPPASPHKEPPELRPEPVHAKRLRPTHAAHVEKIVENVYVPPAVQPAPDSGGIARAGAVSIHDAAGAYARLLWQTIMAQRPAGVRLRGTAVVRFSVAANGRLLDAGVVQSSESEVLDGIALETVHAAAPFPAPPHGLSDDQRSFTIPFEFK